MNANELIEEIFKLPPNEFSWFCTLFYDKMLKLQKQAEYFAEIVKQLEESEGEDE